MALRSPKAYLAALRDRRRVLYQGRLVKDVTAHPDFRRTTRAVAQFYELQAHPDARDSMTYTDAQGERSGMAFKLCESRDDLLRKVHAHAMWAKVTCGFMGRAPDYMAACVAGLAAGRKQLEKIDPSFPDRILGMYEWTRRGDRCLTHTFVRPFANRSQPAPVNAGGLRVVRETRKGITLSGIRGLATLAPFSDANLNVDILPSVDSTNTPFALLFLLPNNARGLSWTCRDSYLAGPGSEHSIASWFDEVDAVAHFEDCVVPTESIIHVRGAENLKIFEKLMVPMWGEMGMHSLVRGLAKTELLVGIAHLMAKSSGLSAQPQIEERLGELVQWKHTLRLFQGAALDKALQDPLTGHWYPNPIVARRGISFFAERHHLMLQLLQELGGSRYQSATQLETVEAVGEAARSYLQGIGMESAAQNVALFRLAWDLIGSAWGIRHDLYEQFSSAHYKQLRREAYQQFNPAEAVEMVKRVLGHSSSDKEPIPLWDEVDDEADASPIESVPAEAPEPAEPSGPVIREGSDRRAEFASVHTSVAPDWLEGIEKATLARPDGLMLSGRVSGRFLSFLVGLAQPKLAVDVGTYTGYSALAIAEGMPRGGRVLTIESHEAYAALARKHFAQSPYAKRIELSVGDALARLQSIDEPIGFAFIDADKTQYSKYLEPILKHLAPNGLIVADNTMGFFPYDLSAPPAQLERIPPTLREWAFALLEFNRRVQADQRLECVMLPVRDGMTLIRRRQRST